MSELEQAKLELVEIIKTQYICRFENEDSICLDGDFSLDDLKTIALVMENAKGLINRDYNSEVE